MIVMSVAGVDPSAGAGVYADLKTFQALGVYGTGAVTALTCQNPNRMFSLKGVDSDYVGEQIDSIMDSYDVRFVKTGMLYSADIIRTVADRIERYGLEAVVDPVMASTSGGQLSKNETVDAFRKYLLPKAIFTTPNVDEAEQLTGIEINNQEDAIDASLKLSKYCDNVITGGHLKGISIINIGNEITVKKVKLIKSDNLHGTGCNYSSAIAAYLAKGLTLKEACLKSFDYVTESIKNGNYGTLIPKI